LIYRFDADKKQWIRITKPNFEIKNLFGIKRDSRELYVELGALLQGIPDKFYLEIKNFDLKETIPDSTIHQLNLVTHSVINYSPVHQLIGKILIIQKKLVPWAWAESPVKVVMPAKLLELQVINKRLRD